MQHRHLASNKYKPLFIPAICHYLNLKENLVGIIIGIVLMFGAVKIYGWWIQNYDDNSRTY